MGIPGPAGLIDPIPDQTVLGNDSGALKKPYPITVHQELDWILTIGQWLFDGIDDRIDFGDFNGRERTQPFSIQFWATTVTGGAGVTKFNLSNGAGIEFNHGGTFIYFYLADATAASDLEIHSAGSLPLNVGRHHCLVTYNGNSLASGVKLYVDSVAVAMTTIGGGSVSNSILNTAPLCVGGFDTAGSFAGLIEHPAMWHVELTAAQVLEAYAGGTPPDLNALATAPKPVFWSKLDANDTTGAGGVIDYGTGAHNGTAEGGLTPAGTIGSLPVRGTSIWEPLIPGPAGWVLTSTGLTSKPAYRQLPPPVVITTTGEEAGPQGDPGPPGPRGATGATGDRGPPGNDGIDGLDGDTGPQGIPGPTGPPGPAGPPGQDGIDGQDGQDGQPGTIGLVSPNELSPGIESLAVPFIIGPIAMSATGAGADDVVVYSANAPFDFRIIKMMPIVTTGVLLGTLQARDATGGGGTAVSSEFGATVASDEPAITTNNGLTGTIAIGGTLAIRRSSGDIVGEASFLCIRI
jgi:hypothetical protein